MPRDPQTLPGEPLARLLAIMAQLRAPEGGCPWDLAQSFGTIAPYTIEEAYEVAEAIRLGDMAGLREELGDLLLQVVFHARMAEEDGQFDFSDVAASIADKMVRRHPHVFADGEVTSAAAQTASWETIKAAERAEKAVGQESSVLDNVPLALPALTRAEKLQKRAARVGFDWPDLAPVLAKIEEELGELKAELADGAKPERVQDEMGDLLFAVANLARHLKVDPETALRAGNSKFERRFRQVEAAFETREGLAAADLEAMEEAWQAAKAGEKGR